MTTTADPVAFSTEAQKTVRMFLSKTLPLPSAPDFLKILAARRTTRSLADHCLVLEGWMRAGGKASELMTLARDTRLRAKEDPQDAEAQEISQLLSAYQVAASSSAVPTTAAVALIDGLYAEMVG